MRTYAAIEDAAADFTTRSRMLTYADVCGRMQTYADVCGRTQPSKTLQPTIYYMRQVLTMLTYADVC